MSNINIRTVRKVEKYDNEVRSVLSSKGANFLTSSESEKIVKKLGYKVSNEMRSKVEVYLFKKEKPTKYFCYVDYEKRKATTWTGEYLGKVFSGRPYRSNFGDIRVNIDVMGINGVKYHGIYYKSAGDYARLTAYKHQT